MKSMSAKDAKNGFGLLLDTALAQPVTIEKHGRAVVVVMAVETYEQLMENAGRKPAAVRSIGKKARRREGAK